MLMSPTLPGPAHVTKHGEKLLAAVRSVPGQWVNRSAIAAAMNKKRLTQWEIAMLGLLMQRGELEARKTPSVGITGYQWEYRAKPE